MTQVVIAKTALTSLDDIRMFSYSRYEKVVVDDFVDMLLLNTIDAIKSFSETYPYSIELQNFGLKYKERIHENYRCIYKYSAKQSTILLFLHSRQNIIDALYRHQIMR